MSARTIRCGSSTHSSMGLTLPRRDLPMFEPKETGRPGYAPADLLKLYIYGYLNRVRSSRRLEAETHRNIEVIWLLRHLKPDFKTIADFRRDNRHAFRPVFRQFVLLCRESGPVRPRAAGGRRHADQGGEQQGSQLHPRVVGRSSSSWLTPRSTTTFSASTAAMPPSRQPAGRGSRTCRRRSPRFASGAGSMPGDAGGAGAHR